MSASAKFEKAVAIVGALPKDGPVKTSQEDQLKFYKLFKQATIGDVNTTRPGMMDFTGKAKWDAWKSVEGKSSDEAKAEYVEALKDVLTSTGGEESKKYLDEIDAA